MFPPRRSQGWIWMTAFWFSTLSALSAPTPITSGAKQYHKQIEPILTQYCYDCHADGANKGGIAFDQFKSDTALVTNRDLWWNALKYMRSGIMPPAKKDKPTDEEKQQIATWIKGTVFGIDDRDPDPGRVTLRRLNRVEYHNTIRDLLGVDFNADVEFPPDDTGYGFDDIGDVLTLSPMLFEKYIAAARTIVTEAVPVITQIEPEIIIAGSRFVRDGETITNRPGKRPVKDTMLSLSYAQPASLSAPFELKHDGDYEVTMTLAVHGPFNFDPGKCHIILKLDGQEIAQKDFAWQENKTFPLPFDEKLTNGKHQLSFELTPLNLTNGADGSSNELRIVSLNVRGPKDKQYWDRPKNYARFFPKDPPESAEARLKYAHEILADFATKAFRRPVDDKTVDRFAKFAETIYSEPGKSFEEGIAEAIEGVISSPRFLFRIEESAPHASGKWSLVDEYSLASRLSYFLWSTMPDDELTKLAARGELRKNLPAQVKRLLDDSRSQAFVQNFTGQWLQLRDVSGIPIDARAVLARDDGSEKQLREQALQFKARQADQVSPVKPTNSVTTTNLIAAINNLATNTAGAGGSASVSSNSASTPAARPNEFAQGNAQGNKNRRGFFKARIDLTGDIRTAMKIETQMFFDSIIREDRNVADMLDADYTFLNGPLAKYYGLTNLDVTGADMRRVTLPPGSPRGGILTQGSMLVVTSNPDRTSPVKRGLFVLNNILGTPAPPPPPNIPALEVSEKSFTGQEPTLRATLELHRSSPLCFSCHSRMDPIGLGLENFNAMGLMRTKERGQDIDVGGKLVTGETFTNVSELKHILATKHRTDFYRCLTEKMLTYAVGRGLEYYDVGTVDKIVDGLEHADGHFSALLTGIIESAPFQEQRNTATAEFSGGTATPVKETAASTRKTL